MPKQKRDVSLFILIDKHHRFLMQHRTEDAPLYPGYWSFFGGGLEEGETATDALIREIKEELDYDVINPLLVLSVKYEWEHSFGKRNVFLVQYDHHQKITLGEGQGMAWVNIADMNKLKLEPYILETIEQIQPYLPNM